MTENIRPEVMAFARMMELKLRENERKGGWTDCDTDFLLDKSGEHRDRLIAAVELWHLGRDNGREPTTQTILRRAVHAANFLMMVTDVCGALPKEEKPSD